MFHHKVYPATHIRSYILQPKFYYLFSPFFNKSAKLGFTLQGSVADSGKCRFL